MFYSGPPSAKAAPYVPPSRIPIIRIILGERTVFYGTNATAAQRIFAEIWQEEPVAQAELKYYRDDTEISGEAVVFEATGKYVPKGAR